MGLRSVILATSRAITNSLALQNTPKRAKVSWRKLGSTSHWTSQAGSRSLIGSAARFHRSHWSKIPWLRPLEDDRIWQGNSWDRAQFYSFQMLLHADRVTSKISVKHKVPVRIFHRFFNKNSADFFRKNLRREK